MFSPLYKEPFTSLDDATQKEITACFLVFLARYSLDTGNGMVDPGKMPFYRRMAWYANPRTGTVQIPGKIVSF